MKTISLFFWTIIIASAVHVATLHADTKYRKILAHKPINFSPHLLEDEYSIQVMRQCMESLLTLGDDNQLQAGLAESWSLSRDKRTYTFRLRKNLKYSDGSKFKAEDFANSIENILKPDSILKKEMSVIEGAAKFTSGKANVVSGIRVIDASTIQIRLSRPFPPFLYLLSAPEFGILKSDDLRKLRGRKVVAFASLGPYFIKTITDRKILLSKNPFFFDASKVYFDTVEYDVGVSEKDAISGFQSGKYDDIYPYEVPEEIGRAAGGQKIPTFTAMSWYIEFNLTKPYVNQLQFRRLLFKYFDFDEFLKTAKRPAHFRAFGLIPRGFLGFKSYRPTPAVNDGEALATAGCSLSHVCKIILYHPYPELQKALEVGFKKVTSKYKQIQVVVQLEERTQWYNRFVSDRYSMVAVGNTSRYPDTLLFLKYLAEPRYHPGLDRSKILNVLNKTLKTDDRAQRQTLFEKADDLLFEQQGIIPLFFGELPFRWVSGKLQPFQSPVLGFSKVRIDRLRERAAAR